MSENENLSNLIQQQKNLLEQITSKNFIEELLLPGEKIFVDNLFRDEIRDGFVVTSQRKRLWNVQLNIIAEFDRICKKHDIRWFAIGGTLIGAARHGGFVPWDDDVDVAMLRPEYEKFRKVAPSEITSPYLLDIWYNYRLEIDEPSELTDNSLPLISLKQHKKHPCAAPFFPQIKIRDCRTLFIEFSDKTNFNQSIWLDIFPLDSLPPFAEKQQRQDFEYVRALFIAAVHPEMMEETLEKNQSFVIEEDTLRKFMSLPYKQRCLQVEDFLAEKFFMSEHVGDLRGWCIRQNRRIYHSEDFKEIIYLPFEKIEVPAPVGYDSVLTDFYGEDWRTPLFTRPHAKIYSAEISYKNFLEESN